MVVTLPSGTTAAASSSSSSTTILGRGDNNSSPSSSSSFWVSILIFTSTVVVSNLLATHLIKANKEQQQQRKQSSDDPESKETIPKSMSNLSKGSVLALRQQYFSKSVSVSYLNSGGLMILRGKGSRLFDDQSTSYLDTRNNVCHVGHCHPKVVEAVSYQLSQLNTNTRYLHPNAVLLAERLVNVMPSESKLQVVFFVNSGSEANDLALRLAHAHTRSNNTIVVEGGYHGHTLEVLRASPYKFSKGTEFPLQYHNHNRRRGDDDDEGHNRPSSSSSTTPSTGYSKHPTSFPTPSHNIYQVPVPDMYRGRHRYQRHDGRKNVNEEPTRAFEREKLGERYAQYVVDACEYYRSQHNENVGALILEGGMSVGGVILPPTSYFHRAVKAVRQAGGVWIADEVQTGFGRLGPKSSFWAFSHHNHSNDNNNDDNINDNNDSDNNTTTPATVFPDIVTMGKPMGNGMAIGAVVTTREIAESFEQLGIEYFNTFGGNPVACAASLAMLDVLEDENLPQHAFEVGTYLRRQFFELDCPWIGDIRGSGLFIGIELIRPPNNNSSENDPKEVCPPEPATAETSFICTLLKDKYHILTSIDGLYDNVLVVKPPLVFSYEDVDVFVHSFQLTIEELERLDDGIEKLKRLGKTPT